MNPLTKEQALQKLRHYCAYQERCHSEVRDKLYQLGSLKRDHDEILATLIVEGFLNEERFAVAYAGGKWRTLHWGRNKIRQALQRKGVSEYCTRKGLNEIEEEDYERVLAGLLKKKYAALKNIPYLLRKKRTMDYLKTKGFEIDRILKTFKREVEKK